MLHLSSAFSSNTMYPTFMTQHKTNYFCCDSVKRVKLYPEISFLELQQDVGNCLHFTNNLWIERCGQETPTSPKSSGTFQGRLQNVSGNLQETFTDFSYCEYVSEKFCNTYKVDRKPVEPILDFDYFPHIINVLPIPYTSFSCSHCPSGYSYTPEPEPACISFTLF